MLKPLFRSVVPDIPVVIVENPEQAVNYILALIEISDLSRHREPIRAALLRELGMLPESEVPALLRDHKLSFIYKNCANQALHYYLSQTSDDQERLVAILEVLNGFKHTIVLYPNAPEVDNGES